jgi:serine/threonine protein kinase
MHYKKVRNFKIHMDNPIGKGAFSNVYLGENIETKEIVAIKEIPNTILMQKLGEKGGKESLEKELQISQSLKHTNIVRIYDFVKSANNNYFILEYCAGGDMRSYLKDRKRLDEITA